MKKHVFYFNLLKMQGMKAMKIWLVMVAMVCAVGAWGQGWMRVYGENEPLGAASLSDMPILVNTADGKYLILGFHYAEDNFSPDSVVLVKVDTDGTLLWKRNTLHVNDGWAADIVQANGGGFAVLGHGHTTNPIHVSKYDENGNQLWANIYDLVGDPVAYAITALPEGGYIMVGEVLNSSSGHKFAIKIDEFGNVVWQKLYETNSLGGFTDVQVTQEGSIVALGNSEFVNQVKEYFLFQLNPINGDLITKIPSIVNAEKVLPIANGKYFILSTGVAGVHDSVGNIQWSKSLSFHATDVKMTPNGSFVVSGGVTSSDVHLTKLSGAGDILWERQYGNPELSEKGGGLLLNPDESIVVSGVKYNLIGEKAGLLLIKANPLGVVFNAAITGTLHQDPQSDCLPDPTEPGLAGWLVQAIGNQSFATLTDQLGNFTLPVDTGSYTVTVAPPGPYWEVCNSPYQVAVTEFYDTLSLDFPAHAAVDCPYLTVDISAPFLRRCFDNNYYVHYGNDGTIAAEDATVEVTLDPYFTYVSSTLPLASQNGNVLAFDLGDVAVNDCGSFQITAYLDCDSTVLGQTHCTSAHISPDSLCLPPDPLWDGSSIETEVSCNGDNVVFTLTNVGTGTMPAPLGYIIIEDQIVLLSEEFQLLPGQSTTVTLPANGSTLRLEAQQAAGHPSGFASTGATIEGCGGWMSLGLFTQWAFDDDPDPFTDLDCQANIGSYDPNDKQGFPRWPRRGAPHRAGARLGVFDSFSKHGH
ncbi:MAG: hypothetical protein IPN76_05320 [Saprospiraceae bacterium]|nr:hypothetical protein [Saprospiraceae bacterium]